MKHAITLLALVISAASVAQIRYPFEPVCGFAYRYESYAMGIDKAYRQHSNQPARMDQFCFELGMKTGAMLLAHEDATDCREAYQEGVDQGLKGVSYGPMQTPSECYNPAVTVGLTLLSVQARAEFRADKRTACAKAYTEGRKDGLNNYVMTLTGDNFRDHCYSTGHTDAQLYGNL